MSDSALPFGALSLLPDSRWNDAWEFGFGRAA